MKKLIILLLPLFLYSCFGDSQEVENAKKELLNNNENNKSLVDENIDKDKNLDEIKEETKEETKENSYEINYLTDKFLEIKDIKDISLIKDGFDINGIVNNPDIDKITVNFENKTSSFPKDNYTLKTFKKGDKTFLYRAYKKYETLDFGTNKYEINGYVGENLVSKIEIIVNIEKNDTSFNSGAIIPDIGEEKIVFSGDEENLDIQKISGLDDITCENIDEFLKNNYTWYYWNTCRSFGENIFYVNVLSLSGENYNYERLYLDILNNNFAKILIETGTGVSKDNLKDKNDELKTKEFLNLENINNLFKKLTTN
ncbi:hypothetical protein H3C61_02340 [Candidatus Gracilibacteria bacterium]|nr:hypothetical protein [Candidatus Gracilibacteria bacterium]